MMMSIELLQERLPFLLLAILMQVLSAWIAVIAQEHHEQHTKPVRLNLRWTREGRRSASRLYRLIFASAFLGSLSVFVLIETFVK